jgi:hypothetical protein
VSDFGDATLMAFANVVLQILMCLVPLLVHNAAQSTAA